MNDTPAAAEVDQVSMVYDNGFQALHGVSVRAEPGEFVTLLGPSGCGKTTLLRLIAGFLTPTEGRVLLGGTEVTWTPPERRDTAMVFQSYALFPHMTVAGNIEYGLKRRKLAAAERQRRTAEALAQVSLETQRDKRPAALSGGQQQRVALARAMALRPGVILFDEPLSNLDAKLREQVRFELRRLQRNHGFTAIYVTHDQAEALAMSDRIYLFNEGRVAQEGTPADIYGRPTSRFAADFLGVANVFPVEVTGAGPDGTGWMVASPFGPFQVAASAGPPAAERVYACWRPEDATIVAGDEPPTNSFKLPVDESVFLGNLTDVFGTLPGPPATAVRVQFAGQTGISRGDVLPLAIAPDRITFLEPVQ